MGANMKYLFTSFMRWHGHTPSKIQEFVWSGANISNANPPFELRDLAEATGTLTLKEAQECLTQVNAACFAAGL